MTYIEEIINHPDMTLDRALIIRSEEVSQGNTCDIRRIGSITEIVIRRPTLRNAIIDVTPRGVMTYE